MSPLIGAGLFVFDSVSRQLSSVMGDNKLTPADLETSPNLSRSLRFNKEETLQRGRQTDGRSNRRSYRAAFELGWIRDREEVAGPLGEETIQGKAGFPDARPQGLRRISLSTDSRKRASRRSRSTSSSRSRLRGRRAAPETAIKGASSNIRQKDRPRTRGCRWTRAAGPSWRGTKMVADSPRWLLR
jgi:hypothetical protein